MFFRWIATFNLPKNNRPFFRSLKCNSTNTHICDISWIRFDLSFFQAVHAWHTSPIVFPHVFQFPFYLSETSVFEWWFRNTRQYVTHSCLGLVRPLHEGTGFEKWSSTDCWADRCRHPVDLFWFVLFYNTLATPIFKCVLIAISPPSTSPARPKKA